MKNVQQIANAHPKGYSINEFTSEEVRETEPWARKFFRELGTKSPFFRAWFGDWRAYDTKEIEYVPVNTDFVSNGTIPYGDFYNKDTMNGKKALAKLYISEDIDGGHKFSARSFFFVFEMNYLFQKRKNI